MNGVIYDVKTRKQTIIVMPAEGAKTILPPVSTDAERIDLLVAENVALKARLAKIEAVPLVKTALEPVIKDPILAR